jgi:hypothetical protein
MSDNCTTGCGGGSAPLIQNIPLIIRRGNVGRIAIALKNAACEPVDAATLRLAVSADGCDSPEYEEDFFEALFPPLQHRIVKVPNTVGRYYIDWGDTATVAAVVGQGGAYPTGFVGGEVLGLQIDNTFAGNVVFQAADQSLAEVNARINALFGPQLGIYVATDNAGQIRIAGKRKGTTGSVVVLPSTSPSVLTTLGLTVGTTTGTQRDNESNGVWSWLFEWTFTDAAHPGEESRLLQSVYVVPSSMLQLLPLLRLEIDKAAKLTDPASGCFLGYTDENLIQFLVGGLQTINQYQPSVFFSPDTFPYQSHGSVLVWAAMMWGVMSQMLFAIDSDVPQFNDQGAAFVINHQQPLANYLSQMALRLDREIPLFKLHFVRSGTVVTEMGPNYRMAQLLAAAPSGALFRGVFFRS